MSHGDYVRPSGQWPEELVPGPADWERLDVAQSKGINGVSGGLWTPKRPIILGGAGVAMTTNGSLLTGGVTTQTGGRIRTNSYAPSCNARTRQIVVPILQCGVRFDISSVSSSQREDDYIRPVLGPNVWGMAVTAAALGFSNVTLYVDIPRRYLHTGARLATASLNYVITSRPASLPIAAMAMWFEGLPWNSETVVETNPYYGGNMAAWVASTSYALGTYIVPESLSISTGYYYKATSISGTGTSGANANLFAGVTTPGQTVTDNPGANQIVWTCVGRSGTQPLVGQTPDSYYAGGAAQAVAFDTDGTTGSGGHTNVLDTTTNRYRLRLTEVPAIAVLTGVTLNFDSITSLGFE